MALAVALKIVSVLVLGCAKAAALIKRQLMENRNVFIKWFEVLKDKDIDLGEKVAQKEELVHVSE